MSDVLGTLRALVGPKPGMRRIPLPLESYEHPSVPLSAKRLLNLYPEQAPANARSAAALISSPGLVATGETYGAGPIVAMNSDMPAIAYIVSGSRVYRRTQSPFGTITVDDLGDVGVPAGTDVARNLMVTVAVGVTAAVVCVPPNAWTCAHTGALNQIGGTFPGARSVTYLDGYFVFTSDDMDAQFFSSLLLDPTSYDALDFASADGVPNLLRRVMTLAGELWLIGDKAVEVWYNAGAGDFPFRRQLGGTVPFGTASIKTVAVCDGSLFWVTEHSTVVRSKGYQVVRVSTHAIETIIRNLGADATVSAVSYAQDGHIFYALSYTHRTLVYDTVTELWHERSSAADGDGGWLPTAVMQVGERIAFGTGTSGRTFVPVPTAETEDGVAPMRQMVLPPLWIDSHLGTCNRLEIEIEVGGTIPPGTLLLEWSNDGGVSYTGARHLTASTANTRARYAAPRLGSFRQRVFRITAQHRLTVYAIDADLSVPAAVPAAGA